MTVTAAPFVRSSTPASLVDRRSSWIPNGRMIAARILELRKRRGLMIALIVVNIGVPTVFLAVRLIAHAVAPKSYGPAGGYDIFTGLVAGLMYIFGFIVAGTLGASAGSSDLTDGMFRHQVVTGRSRLALYLARIPAGLAIVVPIVAVGFTIVCTICVFAAPTTLEYSGVTVPVGLSEAGFEHWAAQHPIEVLCNLPGETPPNVPCGGPGPQGQGIGGGAVIVKGGQTIVLNTPSHSQLVSMAVQNARADYSDYHSVFLYPSNWLMVRSGLWLELEAVVGLIVGLGLGSLLGQRTVVVVLMVVLEVILTPLLARAHIPHFINGQRGLVGVAMAHLEPAALPLPLGGGGGGGRVVDHGASVLVPETVLAAALVVAGWLVVWTALGAWRMVRRDA